MTGDEYTDLLSTISEDCFLLVASNWSCDDLLNVEQVWPQLRDRVTLAFEQREEFSINRRGLDEELAAREANLLRCGAKLKHVKHSCAEEWLEGKTGILDIESVSELVRQVPSLESLHGIDGHIDVRELYTYADIEAKYLERRRQNKRASWPILNMYCGFKPFTKAYIKQLRRGSRRVDIDIDLNAVDAFLEHLRRHLAKAVANLVEQAAGRRPHAQVDPEADRHADQDQV